MTLIDNVVKPLASPLRRFLHCYGHGVHSPLAYRIVRDVLYLPTAYSFYVYHEIDLACRRMSGRNSIYRCACRFARIVAFINPSGVFISSGAEGIYRQVVRLVAPKAGIKTFEALSKAEMIYISSEEDAISLIELMEKDGFFAGDLKMKAVFLDGVSEKSAESIFAECTGGIYFKGKTKHLIIISPDVQKVSYTVIL